MAQPTTQDFIKGVDFTSAVSIPNSSLNQLVDAAIPAADQGIVITTTDSAPNVPIVPDANTNVKWQRYLWRRILSSSVIVYAWNTGGVNDATLLLWQAITAASVGSGSITNAMLFGNITQDKIDNVKWTSLTGVPGTFLPSGTAGGSLTGQYPSPTITNAAVLEAMLEAQAVNVATKLSIGTPNQLLRTNAGATGAEYFTTKTLPLETLGAALTLVRVNGAGTALEFATPPVVVTKYPVGAITLVAIPANGAITANIPHGLGAVPNEVRVTLRCNTAELGFILGDEILIEDFIIINGADKSTCFTVQVDVTNIVVIRAAPAILPAVRRKDAPIGTDTAITVLSWDIVVRAARYV